MYGFFSQIEALLSLKNALLPFRRIVSNVLQILRRPEGGNGIETGVVRGSR